MQKLIELISRNNIRSNKISASIIVGSYKSDSALIGPAYDHFDCSLT